jgi:hypothetical protein
MVAWPIVCRPTELGGLGIPDLRLTSIALQTRWLWLQKVDQDRAWSSLPIASSKEVRAFFNASTYTVLGNGRSTHFWTGKWIQTQSVKDIAPALLAFVSQRISSLQRSPKDSQRVRGFARFREGSPPRPSRIT